MATVRLIAMHTRKGRSIAQSLKDIFEYVTDSFHAISEIKAAETAKKERREAS